MKDFILIDSQSSKPKYQQLIEFIIDSIENGNLARGQQLPSINEVAQTFGMARMTVTKAYDELRERGLVTSHHGKGFYVNSTDTRSQLNVFVLFDSLTPYKEILYDALVAALGESVTVNIFFHHHNIKVFDNLILNNLGHYNFYVIMPHFNQDVSEILSQIPKEKLLILDIDVPSFGDEYAILYQDFEQNIYQGLSEAKDLIMKYQTLSLVLSSKSFQYTPVGIINGFKKFCTEYGIAFEIIPDLEEEEHLQKDHAYLVFRENDLVRFINWSNKKSWKLGRDIGLISYDDTPIKEILAEGISVISNDFHQMGLRAAEMITERQKGRFINYCSFIKRNSL
ncbi:GntR family transcriptional regulator [Flectobacillus major]|jgi:DNA-binding transcriptional regulator YhcF (GntR family)|uniref:GntR family transcriptional regulator n=1 Tax=Flectobacillus major TaxID=103 RepID=UPI000426A407|nr:GntR family transcriptional regulator [Flectobacillus major]